MKLKSLQPLFFVLIILIIISSYMIYITSIGSVETKEKETIEEKEDVAEEEPQEEEIEKRMVIVEPEQEKKEVIIEIGSGFFEPDEITIPVGTTVTWVNNDRRPHGVTDTKRRFYESRISPGETYSFTFTEEGAYNYFDVVFYQVKGKVMVESEFYPITGSTVLRQGNPKLAGVAILLLVGVMIAFILGREKKH